MECKPKTHSLAPTQKKGVKNLVETRRNLNKLFQRKVKLHTKKKEDNYYIKVHMWMLWTYIKGSNLLRKSNYQFD